MSIVKFTQPGDDPLYLAWLDTNPEAYVANTEPDWHGYNRLHRATCRTIRYRPPFITPSYHKYCSTSLEKLVEDAAKNGTVARRCGAYQCWPPGTS